MFLDLSSAASGESAGLPAFWRLAARSPAEEGTNPTTSRGGEQDGTGEASSPADAAVAKASSPELPPQGVRGGVGAPRLGSISDIRRGFPSAKGFALVP